MKIHKNKKINTKKGFTILETIVAIFILLTAISGPLVFSQNGLKASFVGRDQTIAFYLAQDALEFIKNVRDNNALSVNNNWLFGLGECTNFDCTIDTTVLSGDYVKVCTTPGSLESGCSLNYPLKISSNGAYGFDGADDSKFMRTIKIEETAAGREAKIDVKVGWVGPYAQNGKYIEITEYIYNWYTPYRP